MDANDKDQQNGQEILLEETEQEKIEDDKPAGNAITKLYDKLPFTFKQVDIFVKVLLGVLVVLLIYGIVKGNMG